jgi:hypothetical protein
VLTFAIRPALFEDDGPAALAALKASVAEEKSAAIHARRQGPHRPDEADEDSEG